MHCIEKVSEVSATDAFSPSAKHAANVPSQADKYPSLPLFSFLLFCTFTADFYWARTTFQRSLKALPNDDECVAAAAAQPMRQVLLWQKYAAQLALFAAHAIELIQS